MFGQHTEITQIRWQPVLATSDVPPFAIQAVLDCTNDGILIVTPPSDEQQFVYVNGEVLIPAGNYGLMTKDSPIYALCDEPPGVDVPYGPIPGSIILHKDHQGWKGQGAGSYIEGRGYLRRHYTVPDELVLCIEYIEPDDDLHNHPMRAAFNQLHINASRNISFTGIYLAFPGPRKINITNVSTTTTVTLEGGNGGSLEPNRFVVPVAMNGGGVRLGPRQSVTVARLPEDGYHPDPQHPDVGRAVPGLPRGGWAVENAVPDAGVLTDTAPTHTALVGTTVWDQTNRTQFVSTDGTTTGWTPLAGMKDGVTTITPGATENDLVITPLNRLVLANPAAPSTISGISTAAFTEPNGLSFQLLNISANTITLPHNSTSTAVYRIYTPTQQAIQVPQYSGVVLKYSTTLSRWVVAEMLPTPARTGAGAPAGTSVEGVFYWDTTNTILYVYSSGWVQVSSTTVLPPLGSANQIIGVDGGGAALENKTLTTGAGITVTHSAGGIEISTSALLSLTVRESDLSPSVAAATLEFGYEEFTVTDSGGGVATINSRPEFAGNILANQVFGS